jgi:hypothetical protein
MCIVAFKEKIRRILRRALGVDRALEARLDAFAATLRDGIVAQLAAEIKATVRHETNLVKQTVNVVASRQPVAGRIRCLFLVHNFEAWDSLADVHAAMAGSADFHPVVATVPRRYPGSDAFCDEEVAHAGLLSLGVQHIRLNMDDSFAALDVVKAVSPDVIFRQSQWDADVGPGFATEELRFARLCYVPYPILNLVRTREAARSSVDYDSDTAFHRSCWRIFCATRSEADRYAADCLRGGEQVVLSGHPKVARLLRAGAAAPNWPVAGDGTRRRRVVWSPHHSVGDDWSKFGSFLGTAAPMLDWARTAADADFVLSPHPALFKRFAKNDLAMSAAELGAFLAEWRSLPNTFLFEGGNYAPLLAACDAVVTDGLSMLIEGQVFGKPVVFVERRGHAPFTRAGDLVVRGVHAAATVAEARLAVAGILAGGDPLAPVQRDLLHLLTACGDAAANILGSIRAGVRGAANPDALTASETRDDDKLLQGMEGREA